MGLTIPSNVQSERIKSLKLHIVKKMIFFWKLCMECTITNCIPPIHNGEEKKWKMEKNEWPIWYVRWRVGKWNYVYFEFHIISIPLECISTFYAIKYHQTFFPKSRQLKRNYTWTMLLVWPYHSFYNSNFNTYTKKDFLMRI